MSAGSSHASHSSPDKVPWAAYPFIALIYIYRYTLSPLIGNQCRFAPTCSHYAEDALKKYGAVRGIWLAVKRIARCHPWHEGGFDPIP